MQKRNWPQSLPLQISWLVVERCGGSQNIIWHLKVEKCEECHGIGKIKAIHPERVRECMTAKFIFELDGCVMSPMSNGISYTSWNISPGSGLDWTPWGKIPVRTRDQCESKAPLPVATSSQKNPLWILYLDTISGDPGTWAEIWKSKYTPKETEENKRFHLHQKRNKRY